VQGHVKAVAPTCGAPLGRRHPIACQVPAEEASALEARYARSRAREFLERTIEAEEVAQAARPRNGTGSDAGSVEVDEHGFPRRVSTHEHVLHVHVRHVDARIMESPQRTTDGLEHDARIGRILTSRTSPEPRDEIPGVRDLLRGEEGAIEGTAGRDPERRDGPGRAHAGAAGGLERKELLPGAIPLQEDPAEDSTQDPPVPVVPEDQANRRAGRGRNLDEHGLPAPAVRPDRGRPLQQVRGTRDPRIQKRFGQVGPQQDQRPPAFLLDESVGCLARNHAPPCSRTTYQPGPMANLNS
jgi:hypothetical protein